MAHYDSMFLIQNLVLAKDIIFLYKYKYYKIEEISSNNLLHKAPYIWLDITHKSDEKNPVSRTLDYLFSFHSNFGKNIITIPTDNLSIIRTNINSISGKLWIEHDYATLKEISHINKPRLKFLL